MKYGSVCSGIEAATSAWHQLGWKPVFFAEVDSAASAVLATRYPNVPNHGDFTTIQKEDYEPIDVLVGGTPCQDFSIAGLRAGMGGERGNLTLEFLRLADRLRPEWLVWENVPGVLSSHSHASPDPCPPPEPLDMELDGQEMDVEDEYDSEELHAFNSFLAGLSELGYGWSYVVRDAQYFGVPQRRRRVFVVGHLGDWRRAAAVLLEFHSLSGDPAPRREKGQVAPTIPSRSLGGGGLGTDFDCDGGLVHTSPTLRAGGNRTGGHRPPGTDVDTCETLIPILNGAKGRSSDRGSRDGIGIGEDGDPMFTLAAESGHAIAIQNATRGKSQNGLGVSDDGSMYTLDQGSQHAVAFVQNTRDEIRLMGGDGGIVGALAAEPGAKQQCYVAMNLRGREGGAMPELDDLASLRAASGGSSRSYVAGGMAVRRLTPTECERLMGQEDGYTLVPYRGKMMADGPRYKMLGNSMVTQCMRWIGERIEMVEELYVGQRT